MAWDEELIEKFEQIDAGGAGWDSLSPGEQNAFFSWQDEELAKDICLVLKIIGVAGLMMLVGLILMM